MADQRNQNILKAQKKLNELYKGQAGFLESPEQGILTLGTRFRYKELITRSTNNEIKS